jgi:hypothetical protein
LSNPSINKDPALMAVFQRNRAACIAKTGHFP